MLIRLTPTTLNGSIFRLMVCNKKNLIKERKESRWLYLVTNLAECNFSARPTLHYKCHSNIQGNYFQSNYCKERNRHSCPLPWEPTKWKKGTVGDWTRSRVKLVLNACWGHFYSSLRYVAIVSVSLIVQNLQILYLYAWHQFTITY